MVWVDKWISFEVARYVFGTFSANPDITHTEQAFHVQLCPDGKPIIALPSVTAKGESRIVPVLKPGGGVVTTRAHAHYIVTEHGIANLFGKSLRERAEALISIAHPDHRGTLREAAKARFLL